ncbi:glycosyl transferase family 4 [Sediminibacterium goheungense]|uniref:UDP-N-acetylmuramyl pentapeptide phosphotransferase/UDP-N-acetylglucosamine-1-phosphate transferase n=1 Tax=Sediminibacterium goheungense TaxID=1086393 RepID=A0A4R6IY77_9BACT|nr:glycosyl transferase family 4 [Sediminibacterium goheungense]TDO26926.1 UDP-N-acetylmuramyl pentapeptide phosphotransferase/UDP-N-acetylglucosamine-1-phosphate transferase [Sediminibacterium goheungense]
MLLRYSILILFWVGIEWLYFKIARYYAIVDKPNARSSHHLVTIRGGGIIFPIAILVGIFNEQPIKWLLILALLLISVLSFIDDIRNLDSKLRLLLQSIAVASMLYLFSAQFSMMGIILLFILITGVINAYNFMDGINGITVLYSIVTLGSMYWVKQIVPSVLSDQLFIALSSSLLVFGFFNVRKKAACFSGDVGSVSLAFIFCFLLLKITISTNFSWWILFLGIYGIDSVFTITCRIFRKEPLMQAHRSHFYQYLANEAGWTHIQVSLLFAVAQLILNMFVVYSFTSKQIWLALIPLFAFLTIYIIFRLRFEGAQRLFVRYTTG